MTSFLTQCKQCGVSIAKGSPCPDCGWSENAIAPEVISHTLEDFAARQRVHNRNASMNMILMLMLGLTGLLTAGMWCLVIYRGSLTAFVWVGILTVLTGVLGYLLSISKRLWPINLNCPSCDIRLDELGAFGPRCPGCSVQLR